MAELNELDEDMRVEIEGYRTGTYLRLEVHDVPCEMVEYFDPTHPIIVGGLGLGEDSVGYMQVSCLGNIFCTRIPLLPTSSLRKLKKREKAAFWFVIWISCLFLALYSK